MAYADYRAMDTKSALAKFTELSMDPESPQGLRSRAQAMTAFLKNGGAVNYGSVPPEASPQAPLLAAPTAPADGAPPAPAQTPAKPAAPAAR